MNDGSPHFGGRFRFRFCLCINAYPVNMTSVSLNFSTVAGCMLVGWESELQRYLNFGLEPCRPLPDLLHIFHWFSLCWTRRCVVGL